MMQRQQQFEIVLQASEQATKINVILLNSAEKDDFNNLLKPNGEKTNTCILKGLKP